jgi:predicted  nucleic acid-binding Zn-ribbon protein
MLDDFNQQMKTINQKLDDQDNNSSRARKKILTDLNDFKDDFANLKNKISNLNDEITTLNGDVKKLNNKVESLTEE